MCHICYDRRWLIADSWFESTGLGQVEVLNTVCKKRIERFRCFYVFLSSKHLRHLTFEVFIVQHPILLIQSCFLCGRQSFKVDSRLFGVTLWMFQVKILNKKAVNVWYCISKIRLAVSSWQCSSDRHRLRQQVYQLKTKNSKFFVALKKTSEFHEKPSHFLNHF